MTVVWPFIAMAGEWLPVSGFQGYLLPPLPHALNILQLATRCCMEGTHSVSWCGSAWQECCAGNSLSNMLLIAHIQLMLVASSARPLGPVKHTACLTFGIGQDEMEAAAIQTCYGAWVRAAVTSCMCWTGCSCMSCVTAARTSWSLKGRWCPADHTGHRPAARCVAVGAGCQG